METGDLTFTCKLGTFVFEEGVVLSRAKMIRDTVMGQFFSPRRGEPMLVDEEDVHAYISEQAPVLSGIPFEVHIRAEYLIPVSGGKSSRRNDTNW